MFYIGISNSSDGKYLRATDKNKRSRFWKSLVEKNGFYHKIIQDDISWEDAIKLEIDLIAEYGRLNNKSGILCNLTDGGDGCIGFPITDEYRKKCSDSQKGRPGRFGADNPFFGKKHTPESMAKKSETTIRNGKLKGKNNPNYGKPVSLERREHQRQFRLGKKHPEETKVKIRAWGKGRPKSQEWKDKNSGVNNWLYGNGHLISGDISPSAKKCVHISTGVEYGCLKSACKELGLSYNTELAYIKVHHKRHHNRKFNYL